MGYFFDVLVISSGILGCFMSLAIACSPFFRSKTNIYLSFSIFILTIIMFFGWLNAGTGLFEMLRAIMWELLIPVTLLSYFLIHTKHHFIKHKYYKLLYLPFALTLVIDIILELDFSMNLYKLPVSVDGSIVQIIFKIEDYLSILFNIVVILWARVLIKKSDNDKMMKYWLLRLNFMLLCIILIWIIQEFVNMSGQFIFDLKIIWVSISILFWFVLYFGVFKLQIAIERKEIHKLFNQQKKDENIRQAQESGTFDPKFDIFTQQSKITTLFIQLMEQKKVYKNPLLSRSDLAIELGVSEGYLSQKINQELGKTVIQIINEYRIAEAKQLLIIPDLNKYSIEAIGLEAGFNSKSVFYNQFKSETGLSPGLYRKQKQVS